MTTCKGCLIGKMGNKGKELVPARTIIKMQGGWVLNHNGELNRNYLGHLILQPKEHRMNFDELSDEEAGALGTNLRCAIRALKDYWKQQFTWDCLERVYIIYFWETPFKQPIRPPEWHMHIHLFPRTKLMVGEDDPTKVAAWHLLELTERASFPSEYRRRTDNTKDLMNYLKGKLTYKDK